MNQKHKGHKKHKEDKHPKASTELPKILLSVHVDTEARLRTLLECLADKWECPDRANVLRWIARDICADFDMCRKHQKHATISRYLHRVLKAADLLPGNAAREL